MKSKHKLGVGFFAVGLLSLSLSAQAALLYDQNVTPDVLFGSGNDNGSWTVNRQNGVELGLRAKVRGANTFNSLGNGTYVHQAGTVAGGATWNYEWSINTDYLDTSGQNLTALTYVLRIDNNPGLGTSFTSFDPVNGNNGVFGVLWDHGIGDNTTGNGNGDNDVPGRTAASYATLIANNNVAQNSWRPHFYMPFNPNIDGVYTFQLEAYDSQNNSVAFTEMTVVVPEPSTYLAGALLALVFGVQGFRTLRHRQTA